jgi:hypothetical protein
MKKIIKAILIILIVVLAVGGTAVVFFQNFKPNEITTKSLIDYRNKTESLDLNFVNFDKRFSPIITTNKNLQNCLMSLSTYLLDDDIEISNAEIIAKLREVDASVSLAESMIKEYKIKQTSTFFDTNLGRNDLFATMREYIVDYATAINLLNKHLNDNLINKNADIKFDMIDMYCRVTIETFKDLAVEDSSQLIKVLDYANLDVVNKNFRLENGRLAKTVSGLRTSM